MSTVNGQGSGLRDSSTGQLVRQLSEQSSMLVRQELELAKAELSEKGKRAGIGAGMFGGAGVAGLLALGALTACLILLLDKGMDTWVAALIVTVVYAAIAGHPGLDRQGPDAGEHAARPRRNRRKREGGRAMGQDPSQIREEIEQTRSEMGDTVDALAHKTDVKSRVKESFATRRSGCGAR